MSDCYASLFAHLGRRGPANFRTRERQPPTCELTQSPDYEIRIHPVHRHPAAKTRDTAELPLEQKPHGLLKTDTSIFY
jgi:hypothetical protein